MKTGKKYSKTISVKLFHHRNFALLSIFFLLFFMSARAQRTKIMNLPKHDHNIVNFGFSLGINKTDFVLDPAANFLKQDSLFDVQAEPGSGFNLGIMSELRITEHLNFRFIPDLSFTQRTLIYTFDTSIVKSRSTLLPPIRKDIQSTFLEFPFEFKYSSRRINNYRMYLLAGMKYSLDMASDKKVNVSDPNPYKARVKIQGVDYGYFFGFGLDCYLQYFRFSPEIKVYHGMNNLVVNDGKVFSTCINQLHSKIFLLSFIFE